MASRRPAALSVALAAALPAAALAVSTAATTTATAGTAATDRTPGWSVHHITVEVKVGPRGDRSCLVDADIYKPDAARASRKRPAILTTNGFGGAKDDSNESAIGRGFVRQGYVVLAYTGLGFPDSGCRITLDDPDYDGRAGRQLVDVLAGTRSYTERGQVRRLRIVKQESPGDPRVGMIGGSYGGQVQYAVAMQDRRVDALIPMITWNDLSYSLAPNNTSATRGVSSATPGVGKRQWVGLFFGVGLVSGAAGLPMDPRRAVGCPGFAPPACPAAARLATLGYPDAGAVRLARHASVATYLHRVTAPTLVVQGQQDTLFNLQEAVATFRGLRAHGNPARMIWQSWGHSDGTPAPGELDFDAASLRSSYLGNRFLNWMNHYVRGDATAALGPRFSYFRDWVAYDERPGYAGRAVAGAYAERGSFDPHPTASLYFTGTAGLRTSRSAVVPGSAAYANAAAGPTSYSETSGPAGGTVDRDPSDAPGTFAAWTSRPLARGVDLVGSSTLTLRLSAPVAARTQRTGPGGRLVLFAKLYDVAPGGRQTLQNRLISPVRVTDVGTPVRIRMPAVAQHFAPGHRIRVAVAASDAAYAGNPVVQPVRVRTGPAAPSVIRMPLTGPLSFR